MDWLDTATKIATIVIAGAAVVGLWLSVGAAKKTKRSASTDKALDFLENYASPSMHDDLKKLGDFGDVQETLLDYLKRFAPVADDLDDDDVQNAHSYVRNWELKIGLSRRKVLNFYKRVWRAYEMGTLDEHGLQAIGETNGVRLLFEVVRPITVAYHLVAIHHSNLKAFRADLSHFDWLDKFSEKIRGQ